MYFAKGNTIAGYTVSFRHKQGAYAESYRVKDAEDKTRFLKLILHNRLSPYQRGPQGEIIEHALLTQLQHPNVSLLIDSGEIRLSDTEATYLVFDFYSCETLAERLLREGQLSVYEIKQIAVAVLSAIQALHSLPQPAVHGELTAQNILSSLVEKGEMRYKLIDFGGAAYATAQRQELLFTGSSLYYMAPERFSGIQRVESDIYAVGALLYLLVYRQFPWYVALDGLEPRRQRERVLTERDKPLSLPETTLFELDEQFVNIIAKALSYDAEDRFRSAQEMLRALRGELRVERQEPRRKINSAEAELPRVLPSVSPAEGKGFAAVAGLEDLKQKMMEEVIEPLRSPERYKAYGITVPNGLLLYGPPGCGKTFFAKHFAEEVGANFMCITPATLKSRYVNATQENIARMFEEAVAQAPTIIFIDEINELLPSREGEVHEMSRSAVNEMLAQMDRTGERGVFIVGATNYPHQIDAAMLRAGRLERKYYLGAPDLAARQALFELALSGRPLSHDIDTGCLASLTEGYVSADIQLIVNDAARQALRADSPITMTLLEESIQRAKPSLSREELDKYLEIHRRLQGEEPVRKERRRIGF